MPTRFNSKITKDAAQKLADNFEFGKYIVHPIQELFEKICKDFESISKEKISSLQKENIQARIRGANILQLYSSVYGGLVTNNANKDEVFTGYCTFYG